MCINVIYERNDNASRYTLYILLYITHACVCAHVHRSFASCVKVFYYFIIERVVSILRSRANKTREKWSIAASTVPRISWIVLAKYCMKLIHGAARFIVRAAEPRN